MKKLFIIFFLVFISMFIITSCEKPTKTKPEPQKPISLDIVINTGETISSIHIKSIYEPDWSDSLTEEDLLNDSVETIILNILFDEGAMTCSSEQIIVYSLQRETLI